MRKKSIKNFFVYFILFNVVFSGLLLQVRPSRADVNKTIVITFSSAPSFANVAAADLKYNKKFAFSYSFDDGLINGYDPAFKYMTGGYSDYLGQYFGGLYFTDGAGNNIPFRGGYAFYSRNAEYVDIHINTPSYINWNQLQEAVDYGWDVFNHGYVSATVPVDEPDKIYYVGDPGGHATGTLDYSYELTQFNVDLGSKISLKDASGNVSGALSTSQIILPNGDKNYIQPGFDLGFNSIYAQDSEFPFDGATTSAPVFINVSDAISANRHVMQRWFATEQRYSDVGEYPNGVNKHVDDLASISSSTDRYWAQEFTHQISNSAYAPDWNGGITWSTWKSLMDHIENTYGRFGDDSAWVAGAEEVYDYLMVKQNISFSQVLSGNQLTIELDSSSVPANLRHYALTLLIDADAPISSIDYGSDFTHHSDNKTDGLINLDWGINPYSLTDVSRVENLVATAEASKRQSDIDVARSYNNLLTDSSHSSVSALKASYADRLDAIVIPLKTWYVNIKGGVTFAANCASSATASFSPSPYNWNHFYVGKGELLCGDLVNLKDSDGQASTLSLANTAPFDGGLSSASTGNNSGLYPDAVLVDNASIYSSAGNPAKIKIYGLENIKTYNIKLFGYTSAGHVSEDVDTTNYTIGTTTLPLIVQGNISNYVEFIDVLPVNGEIEITIVPKVPSWGFGMLNAMEIKENILSAPAGLSYTSPQTYTKNAAITALSPTVTGQGITYSVSPALPTGLSLNTTTGVISGTPSVLASKAAYTITAANTGGSTTFALSLTVNDLAPADLSYTSPQTYTKNAAITALSPTVTGQNIIYSVSPALPAGLSLNTATGVISGTPSAVASTTAYTVTAANTGGSTTFALSLTVNDVAPADLSYTSPQTYTQDEAITALSPTVTGQNLTYSVSPALPAGLSLDTATGVISGTPSAVASTTAYTITAANTGGSTTFALSLTVNGRVYNLNYIAGQNGSISGNATQNVVAGGNGAEVVAVPDSGYHFSAWSDGLSTAARRDLNIGEHKTVTAIFAVDASNNVSVSMPAGRGQGTADVSIPMNGSKSLGNVDGGGFNVLAYLNATAEFTVPESANSWQLGRHSVQITDLDLLHNQATILIESQPQYLTLSLGESKKVDLDGDGIDDLEFTFVDVYINRAEITLKSLDKQRSPAVDAAASSQAFILAEKKMAADIDSRLSSRLSGRILLQVENKGRAWYLDPVSVTRYYLADGQTAYEIMRRFGLGINNQDLAKIPVAADSSLPADYRSSQSYSPALAGRLSGRIVLQVENKGEAWYVDPVSRTRYYLADGEAAYRLMRTLALGITDDNIHKIAVGD
ncbi:MAG: putative Ig domain-containing protein [Patescibacteria group bacterium]|nr:putative Ig domain-containing protein [Patescibacteria group bacterium]